MSKKHLIKSALAAVLVGSTAIGLCSCGEEVEETKTFSVQTFSIDSQTRSVNSTYTEEVSENQSSIEDNEVINSEDNGDFRNVLSEVTLTGDDTSVVYETSTNEIGGIDVEYRGVTFKNLYSNVESLNTKYDTNTLVNFLIKTYEANSSLIYCMVETDTDSAETDDEPLEMMFYDVPQYKKLKSEYNESVSWVLSLVDSETRDTVYMYGCYSYILVTSNGETVEIDMTQYDSGIVKNTETESTTESVEAESTTESVEEQTSESKGGEQINEK